MSTNRSLKSFLKVCFPQDTTTLILHQVRVIFYLNGCTVASWLPSLSDSCQPAPPLVAPHQHLAFPLAGLLVITQVDCRSQLARDGLQAGPCSRGKYWQPPLCSQQVWLGWWPTYLPHQDATLSTYPMMPSVCQAQCRLWKTKLKKYINTIYVFLFAYNVYTIFFMYMYIYTCTQGIYNIMYI